MTHDTGEVVFFAIAPAITNGRITMRIRKTLTAVVITAAAATCTAVTAGPSIAAERSDSATAGDWRGYTVACESAGDTANFRYNPSDNSTTNVYFNNHCTHDVNVTVHVSGGGDSDKCVSASANEKSSERLYVGGEHITTLTRGC
ncbi:hypothetical protein [Streptomyces cucumeris]|uniref:hypothetical protein n=1 Tax=Streptomyces cucumeris TaxID=2962890 RepID=UPI003D719770